MNAEGEASGGFDTERYVECLVADVERFADVLVTGPVDAEVAACPGWTVLRLAEHLGHIHRWAHFCVEHGRPPESDDPPIEAFDPSRPAAWLREGGTSLVKALRAVDPAASTWHPFPVDRVGAVWPRRQAHEAAIHRWDAEHAVGREAGIDARFASDGIDEYFELVVPRLMVRTGLQLPEGSLHVHCTDVEGEWLVWSEGGEYRMLRAHQKGDAALRGPAEALLLRLWGRQGARTAELAPVGDDAVLAAWLAIAGL